VHRVWDTVRCGALVGLLFTNRKRALFLILGQALVRFLEVALSTNQSETVAGLLLEATVDGLRISVIFEDKTIFNTSIPWSSLLSILPHVLNGS
jgi:hypothetical protein